MVSHGWVTQFVVHTEATAVCMLFSYQVNYSVVVITLLSNQLQELQAITQLSK